MKSGTATGEVGEAVTIVHNKKRSRGHGRKRRSGAATARRAPARAPEMQDQISFHLMFLTPAFLSSTNQDAPVISSTTIRELLQWWFRALVGHEAVLGLTDLGLSEAKLFGNPRMGYRCPLRIQVTPGEPYQTVPVGSPAPGSGLFLKGRQPQDAIVYLAGGPIAPLAKKERDSRGGARDPLFNDPATGKARRGSLFRSPAVAPGSRFTVRIGWKPGALEDRQIEDLVRSAASLVTIGGVGPRSRKGFGALTGEIHAASLPQALTWWNSQAHGILCDPTLSASAGYPPTPCLAYATVRTDPVVSPSWETALGRLGKAYSATRPRGDAAWISGSANPKRESSILLSLLREPAGYRGVATLLPFLRPDGEGADELRDYVAAFREFEWPATG